MIMKLPGDFIHTCVWLAIWADCSRPILHSSQQFCWASLPSPFHPFHGCLLMLLMLSLTQYQALGKEMLRHHPFLEMLREYQGSHSQKTPESWANWNSWSTYEWQTLGLVSVTLPKSPPSILSLSSHFKNRDTGLWGVKPFAQGHSASKWWGWCHYAAWKKPGTQEYLLCDSISLKFRNGE